MFKTIMILFAEEGGSEEEYDGADCITAIDSEAFWHDIGGYYGQVHTLSLKEAKRLVEDLNESIKKYEESEVK